MNKPMKLVIFAALVGGAIWGGLATKHYFRCSALEDDFLNATASMKGNVAVRIIGVNDPELTKMADSRDKMDKARSERTLQAIYSDCGERAGQSAFRKASELIRF